MITGKPHVGVLCYGLSSASTTVLNPLCMEAGHEFVVKAYPNVPYEADPSDLAFPYRPSTMHHRRYIAFNTLWGDAPESMLLTMSLSLVWDLVSESDVVCLLGLLGVTGVAVTALARLRGKPIVAVYQGTLPEAERRRSILIRLLKRWLFGVSRVVVSQTPASYDTLREVYCVPEAKIVHAPWDGGASEFAPVLAQHRATPKEALRAEVNVPPGAYVVLYCGTLIYLKGVDTLISSFCQVRERVPSAVLLLAGPDGHSNGVMAQLRTQAADLGMADAVRFMGRVPWDVLARLYLLSDVFVLPTRKDKWPKVLIEAALAGLPLVTTDRCGAAGHVVHDGVNGYVVLVDDLAALGERLVALSDEGLRQRMGEASRRIVSEYLARSKAQTKGLSEAIRRALGCTGAGS